MSESKKDQQDPKQKAAEERKASGRTTRNTPPATNGSNRGQQTR